MQEYKTVTYRVKDKVNSQTVLDDLSRFLNKKSVEGWNTVSVQYTLSLGFLIVLKNNTEFVQDAYAYTADFYRIKGPFKSQSELSDLSSYFNQRAKYGWNILCVQLIDSIGYFVVQTTGGNQDYLLLESSSLIELE